MIEVTINRVEQEDDEATRQVLRAGGDISAWAFAPHVGVDMPASSQRFIIATHDTETGEALDLVVDYSGRVELWAEGMRRVDGRLLARAAKRLKRVRAELRREREAA